MKTREDFLTAVDELYKAVRDSVGYNDHADKLIDQLEEMADAWEHENYRWLLVQAWSEVKE